MVQVAKRLNWIQWNLPKHLLDERTSNDRASPLENIGECRPVLRSSRHIHRTVNLLFEENQMDHKEYNEVISDLLQNLVIFSKIR